MFGYINALLAGNILCLLTKMLHTTLTHIIIKFEKKIKEKYELLIEMCKGNWINLYE